MNFLSADKNLLIIYNIANSKNTRKSSKLIYLYTQYDFG